MEAMSDAKKFLFNTRDFSDQALEAQKRAQDNKIVVPTFSEAEIEAARTRAHKLGVEDGVRQQKESTEQTLVSMMATIGQRINELLVAEAIREAQFERDAVALSTALLLRAYPILEEKIGGDQLTADLEELLVQAKGQEEVILSVHPQIVDVVSQRFAGEAGVKVQSDPSLSLVDATLKWPRGGARVLRSDVLKSMETLLRNALDGREAQTGEHTHVAQVRTDLDHQDDQVAQSGEIVAGDMGEGEP